MIVEIGFFLMGAAFSYALEKRVRRIQVERLSEVIQDKEDRIGKLEADLRWQASVEKECARLQQENERLGGKPYLA